MSRGIQVLVFSLALIFTGVVLASSALAAPAFGGHDSSPISEIASFIVGSTLASLLFALGLAGILLELFAVGHGLAGSIGLGALAMYFGSYILLGHSGWEPVGLFIFGLILVFLEIFILPGGVVGILGALMMFGSVFLVAPTPIDAVISLITSLIGTALILWIGLKFMTKRNLWSKMVLKERQANKEGYLAPQAELGRFLHQTGRTITPLRPAGKVDFNGEQVDVVTEGGFIPVDTLVKVIKVEGTRVIVRSAN